MNVTSTLEDPRHQQIPPKASPEHTPGRLGSQYVLDHQIGQGAFGQIWQGRRVADGASVAIKVPQAIYSRDPEVVARFMRERTTLQALNHPHLVTVLDLVVEGDTLAVVMELIHGLDLRQAAKQGGLDGDDVLTVLAQVAHALAHIHAAGVVHRDIKPENILLSRRHGRPWAQLTDFGMAWVADGRHLTGSSAVVGTPAYLAPELLMGRSYGPPVDVYSLGVTAYELLSGRRPFEAEHPLALMRAHLDDEPERPADMPEGHWRVIRACLAKRPQERPSAEQLAAHFDGLCKTGSPRLAIDLGAASTIAALRRSDGRVEPLLFDGSPLLPSAIHAGPDSEILTGRAALEAAMQRPQDCEPYPKLRLADPTATTGKRGLTAVDLVTAILRRVAGQAQRTAGQVPTRVSIIRPPAWGPRELDQVDRAAKAAGLPGPDFIAEGVAVVAYLAGTAQLPVGAYALIYHLGAATNTASVVRRSTDGGFELLANESLPDVGGIDIDTAIINHLGQRHYADVRRHWQRLSNPDSIHDMRAAWQLWENARQAKHALSHGTNTKADVHLPLIDLTVQLERRQLEELAQPIIDRTVAAARAALASAGLAATDLAATFLIGGSSRMPLVATRLRQAFGPTPTPIERPELVAAEGALHVTPSIPLPTPSPRAGSPRVVVPDALSRIPQTRPRKWAGRHSPRNHGLRRRLLPVTAVGLALAITASVGYVLIRSDYDRQASAASGPCGYKIAFLGSTARPGPAIRAAASLAVDQFNAVNPDCTVELVGFDTFREPEVSEARAKEIASDAKIVGVVGPLGEREAQGALPVLDRADVATISPMLTEDSLAELGWRVFHRTVGAILSDDTPTGIRYLTRKLKATKTFVVDEGDDDSVATTQRARELLGDAFVGSASIHSLENDLAPVVDQIIKSGADSVYYAGYAEVMVALLRELRAEKPDITFLTGRWGYNDTAVAELGSAAEGIYATNPGMALSLADRAFVEKIKTTSRTDVSDHDRSSEAYDAANILLSGLAAGKTSRTEMLTWVRNFNGTGISGPIRFRPNGNRVSVPAHLARVVDGSWKTVGRISGGKGTA